MLEAPGFIAGLHDVAVMGEPIEQRGGELRIPEHGGPLAEAQIGRDHHAGALVELREQVKEQCPAGLAERQVAQLVQDHQVRVRQPISHLPLLAVRLLLLQDIDQLDHREEAHAPMMALNGFDSQRRGEVSFPGARSADQDHILRGIVIAESVSV